MPRIARIHVPGVVHHVISRMVNGEFLISDDELRGAYLAHVATALRRCTWTLLAYAIMSNHVHLALWAGAEPLARWIQSAHTAFATYLQRRRRRDGIRALGPVFAHRPTTVLFAPERVPHLIAYLHNNPVRAGVVGTAAETSWTSHRAYLGRVAPVPSLEVMRGLELAGFGDDEKGRRSFDELVRSREGLVRDPEFTASRAASVSAKAHAVAGSAVQLGSPLLGVDGLRYPLVQAAPAQGSAKFDGDPMCVIEAMGRETGISIADLRAPSRSAGTVRSRRLIVVAWDRLGRRRSEVAAALGVSRQAISKGMQGLSETKREQLILARVLEAIHRRI